LRKTTKIFIQLIGSPTAELDTGLPEYEGGMENDDNDDSDDGGGTCVAKTLKYALRNHWLLNLK
jgi:hypothetical protein